MGRQFNNTVCLCRLYSYNSRRRNNTKVGIRDLQYISIWQYIEKANKYHNTILYLEISTY